MVLIISTAFDPSTDKVLDWLQYKGAAYRRMNGEELFSLSSQIVLELSSFSCQVRDGCFREDISAVWFRRDAPYRLPVEELSGISNNEKIRKSLDDEAARGKEGLFFSWAEHAKVLGNHRRYKINKLEVLITARRCDLDIPATIITNSKQELLAFVRKHGAVITKSICEGFGLEKNEDGVTEWFSLFTEELSPERIEGITDLFYYSLFQEKLDKEIEIRIFYLAGAIYPMAIFSQMDAQTSVDLRKYSNNRHVPYRLPASIAEKIRLLMKELELNTGSLDVVKTRDGRFVLLEVNPVGQYDMTSVWCNYHLDKKIAEYLTDE